MLISMLAALGLLGCGDESSDGRAAVPENDPSTIENKRTPQLEFEADPDGELAYTTDVVTAREGNVTIAFTNPQSVPHNVQLEGAKGWTVSSKTIEDGFDASTNVSLTADERFVFYCTVPGHREAGMKGVVRVKPVGS